MYYSSVLASLFVAGVIGKPIADPAVDYDVKVVKVTKTITMSGDATPEPHYKIDSDREHNFEHNFDFDFQRDDESSIFIPEPAPIPEVIESEPVPLPEVPESDFSFEPVEEAEPVEDSEPSQNEGSSSVSGSPDGDFQDKVLYHHDIHRVNHSASGISWSDTLASIAQETAERCIYEHDTKTGTDRYDGGYGQNIAAGADDIATVLTNMFYNNELELFSQEFGKSQPSSSFKGWGHFTQMVWKSTTEVGCAVVDCSGQGLQKTGATPVFYVCNYGPPGNFQNQYAENVLPPIGNEFVQV